MTREDSGLQAQWTITNRALEPQSADLTCQFHPQAQAVHDRSSRTRLALYSKDQLQLGKGRVRGVPRVADTLGAIQLD